MRRIPNRKTYGSYKTSNCPFCGKIATQKNEQKLDVCRKHTKQLMEEIRCTCGSWLETRSGKFGPYFNCVNCGNLNYKKGLEIKATTTPLKINFPKSIESPKTIEPPKPIINRPIDKPKPKEITITSNDVEYFD